MTHSREILREFVPPIVVRTCRSVLGRGLAFRGPYATWEEAVRASTGYDAAEIVEKVKDAALKVKAGEAAFERDSVAFDRPEFAFPVLAALQRAALAKGGKLSVLDFGGSLGSSYFQCRAFLSPISHLHWNVVEQPSFVDCGQAQFETDELRFHRSVDDCLREERPDVVLLSSVLQYLEDPYGVLDHLIERGFGWIVVDRTPFGDRPDDQITVQIVPPAIYRGSYPAWIFGQRNFRDRFRQKYALLAEFASSEGTVRSGGMSAHYSGFIFERRA